MLFDAAGCDVHPQAGLDLRPRQLDRPSVPRALAFSAHGDKGGDRHYTKLSDVHAAVREAIREHGRPVTEAEIGRRLARHITRSVSNLEDGIRPLVIKGLVCEKDGAYSLSSCGCKDLCSPVSSSCVLAWRRSSLQCSCSWGGAMRVL